MARTIINQKAPAATTQSGAFTVKQQNRLGDISPCVGPIIFGVHVDYSDNHKLFEMVKEERIH